MTLRDFINALEKASNNGKNDDATVKITNMDGDWIGDINDVSPWLDFTIDKPKTFIEVELIS